MRRLEVYVAAHCITCGEARRLASLAGTVFHDLGVRVIDVTEPIESHSADDQPRDQDHRHQVVAVPTYILDGRVIALGNPSAEELFAALGRRARRSSSTCHAGAKVLDA